MPFSDIVADNLLCSILRGHLTPGDRLPPENDLALQFQVSRSTVREAVRTLSARGIVRVRRGAGTEIAPVEKWRSMIDEVRFHVARGAAATVAEQLRAAQHLLEPEAVPTLITGDRDVRVAPPRARSGAPHSDEASSHHTASRRGSSTSEDRSNPFSALLLAALRAADSGLPSAVLCDQAEKGVP